MTGRGCERKSLTFEGNFSRAERHIAARRAPVSGSVWRSLGLQYENSMESCWTSTP